MHFKNKYKFKILKTTLMPQIKEAFVGSNANTKSILQYPFDFCFDASFIGTIPSRNWHLLFVLCLLISDLTFVSLLLSLLVFVQPDISKIFFRIMRENNCSHKNVLLIIKHLENQLNNFWTWNNSMLKYHPGDYAELIIIIWAQFGGQVHCTPRLNALKLFPETVFPSDRNNNLKWAILGT